MKFSKKLVAIIALILVLAATNVILAVLYMTKNVTITGGVSTIGAIEVYDEDRTTVLQAYDFPFFIGGQPQMMTKHFFINNTGNQPVYVYWNISSSSITWTPTDVGYYHTPAQNAKYQFSLYPPFTEGQAADFWIPNDYLTPEALNIGVNEGVEMIMMLHYTGAVVTGETFTLVMSFYAQSA